MNLCIDLLQLVSDSIPDWILRIHFRNCNRSMRKIKIKQLGDLKMENTAKILKNIEMYPFVEDVYLQNNYALTNGDLKKFEKLKHVKRINLSTRYKCKQNLEIVQKINIYNLGCCYRLDKKEKKNMWVDMITNEGYQYLKHIKDINVASRYVDNDGLKFFKNANKIDLNFCNNITNDGLKHLSNAQFVALTGCWNIDDEGLKYLSNVRELHLNYCWNIKNGLVHLINVKNLNICQNNIKISSLSYLKNVEYLIVDGFVNRNKHLDIFKNLTKLKGLGFRHNSIMSPINKFKEKYPHIKCVVVDC